MIKFTKTIFTGIGILLLVVSVFLFIHKITFVLRAQTAEGQIVSIQKSISKDKNGHNKTYYAPKIRYLLTDGSPTEFVSSLESTSNDYQTGMPVKVLYDPHNPSNAEIDSLVTLWLGPFVAFIIGIVFFIIGMLLILISKLRGRKDKGLS